jgi:hypothetical protein
MLAPEQHLGAVITIITPRMVGSPGIPPTGEMSINAGIMRKGGVTAVAKRLDDLA